MLVVFGAAAMAVVASDPWIPVKWSTMESSVEFVLPSPSETVVGVTFDSADTCTNVNGHAVVVHEPDGARVGCGVLGHDVWSTMYSSDTTGMSDTSVTVAGYMFDNNATMVSTLTADNTAYNANGRVVVAHTSDGTRIACGCCAMDGVAVVMSTYPGYAGSLNVTGTVTTSSAMGAAGVGLTLTAALDGLEINETGGLHIHSGTSCASADDVGGHFFSSSVATIGVYPEYAGNYSVSGAAEVEGQTDAIMFSANLVDNGDSFAANTTGGIHIHEGTTCDDAATVGGHFYDPVCTTTITAAATTNGSDISAAAVRTCSAAAAVVALVAML